jgi:hypothetical protein
MDGLCIYHHREEFSVLCENCFCIWTLHLTQVDLVTESMHFKATSHYENGQERRKCMITYITVTSTMLEAVIL